MTSKQQQQQQQQQQKETLHTTTKSKLHGILFTGTKDTSLSRDSNTIFKSGRVTD